MKPDNTKSFSSFGASVSGAVAASVSEIARPAGTSKSPALTSNDRALMCSLAATLIDGGNVKAGINVAAFIQSAWPHDEQALSVLAHAHLSQNNHAAVATLLGKELLTGRLRKPQLWFMFGIACLKTMQPARAFDAARRYLTMKV